VYQMKDLKLDLGDGTSDTKSESKYELGLESAL
jgi:hypothetical protein